VVWSVSPAATVTFVEGVSEPVVRPRALLNWWTRSVPLSRIERAPQPVGSSVMLVGLDLAPVMVPLLPGLSPVGRTVAMIRAHDRLMDSAAGRLTHPVQRLRGRPAPARRCRPFRRRMSGCLGRRDRGEPPARGTNHGECYPWDSRPPPPSLGGPAKLSPGVDRSRIFPFARSRRTIADSNPRRMPRPWR
jgi:hypothetical protein